MSKSKILYRTWPTTGNVIAVFPDIAVGQFVPDKWCIGLSITGNKLPVDLDLIKAKTRPATTNEISSYKQAIKAIRA